MLHSRFVLPGEQSKVNVAFTDRWGGFSSAPYASLNLAFHVGDDETAVLANRASVAAALGLREENMKYVNQVHGTTVVAWDASGAFDPHTGDRVQAEVVTADAHVTAEDATALVVLVADCVPVVVADPDLGIIGAIHAGRKGMASGVVPRTIEAMRALGARSIQAAIGPSICPRCYEVGEDMRRDVAAREPVTASVSSVGSPALDVAAGVAEQLRRLGCSIVEFASDCTRESPELFSYRRDSTTGRFAGIVWLKRINDTPRENPGGGA